MTFYWIKVGTESAYGYIKFDHRLQCEVAQYEFR